jgi:hypothetical protein
MGRREEVDILRFFAESRSLFLVERPLRSFFVISPASMFDNVARLRRRLNFEKTHRGFLSLRLGCTNCRRSRAFDPAHRDE